MNADQDAGAGLPGRAPDQGEMFRVVDERAVDMRLEHAVARLERRSLDTRDQPLRASAIGDQVGDRDERQGVGAREFDQPRQAHHGAVVVDDLAENAGRVAARDACQIDRRLGVARPRQDAAGTGAQGKDMAGPGEIARAGVAIAAVAGERADRACPVGGRDARRRAVAIVDRNRERGAVLLRVVLHHLGQVQLVEPSAFHRNADDARGVAHEERDHLRSRAVRRHDEVALVLARLVIHDDHGPAGGEVADGVLDRGEDVRPAHDNGPAPPAMASGRQQIVDLVRKAVQVKGRLQNLAVEHGPGALFERQDAESAEKQDTQAGQGRASAARQFGPVDTVHPVLSDEDVEGAGHEMTHGIAPAAHRRDGMTLTQQHSCKISPQHIVLGRKENPRHQRPRTGSRRQGRKPVPHPEDDIVMTPL